MLSIEMLSDVMLKIVGALASDNVSDMKFIGLRVEAKRLIDDLDIMGVALQRKGIGDGRVWAEFQARLIELRAALGED